MSRKDHENGRNIAIQMFLLLAEHLDADDSNDWWLGFLLAVTSFMEASIGFEKMKETMILTLSEKIHIESSKEDENSMRQ